LRMWLPRLHLLSPRAAQLRPRGQSPYFSIPGLRQAGICVRSRRGNYDSGLSLFALGQIQNLEPSTMGDARGSSIERALIIFSSISR
jgi:hypothetical protein